MSQVSSDRKANRILGYPDDARLLIVNADDFGMCHANNEAIRIAMRDGIVTSTTLMAPCPWAPHAMQVLTGAPERALGVHLTLVCDVDMYRWGPLADRSDVTSLVDHSGRFVLADQIPELLARAAIGEVEAEFRAQIEAVLVAGLTPTHLDWHCLADGGREDIFQCSLALAREYGLAMRVHLPEHVEMCRKLDLPCVDHSVLDSYRIDPATKPLAYTTLLRELPAGLSEWAVHPGMGTPESRALEPETWRVRRSDLDVLTSSAARRVIDGEGIILLDYRSLQLFWAR